MLFCNVFFLLLQSSQIGEYFSQRKLGVTFFISSSGIRESLLHTIKIVFSLFVTFMFNCRMVLAGSTLQSSFIDGTAIVFLYDDEYGLTQDEVNDFVCI